MKQCMVCLADVDAAAPTCPHCGEASWGASAAPVDASADTDPAPAVDDPSDITTADASPRAKRGRRGA